MLEKTSVGELAIFGGEPAFSQPLYVGRPNIGNRERLLERINDLLDRRWFTNQGPFVQELEERLRSRLGVRHCIPICNGTVALEIAFRAAELSGEVIVPSMTFVATAHALTWLGITPVFCDVGARTHSLDPEQVEALITPRTTAILGVHLWGRPCEIEDLQEIARRRHLRLLYDAAHAFGCSYRGEMIGNFGDAEIFSFHATKFFNTFEGGAISTNDDELAARVRLMRNFGFEGYDRVVSLGINGKMSEVSAAMGLTLLEDLEGVIEVNFANYQEYQKGLTGLPGVTMVAFDETAACNYQYIVLEIDQASARVSRDQVLEILWAENVHARRYFFPGCHRMEPYRSTKTESTRSLPQTEKLVERILCLPTGTAVGTDEIRRICQIFGLIVSNPIEVNERLKGSHSPLSAVLDEE